MVLRDGSIVFLPGKRMGVLDSDGADTIGGVAMGEEGEGLIKGG